MVTVLLGGKFNKIHPGHEWLLKEAKKLGDKLVIILANDIRNDRLYALTAKERKKNLEKTKLADVVVIGDIKECSKVVRKYKPEIIVLGYDQKLPIDLEFVRGIKIVRMKKYKNYASRNL